MIPREASFDSSAALLREGYTFVPRRVQRFDSDVFRARVMLREALFAQGEEAARVFYHPGRMTRRGALPPTALRLLLDRGSVSLLDGDQHEHRKSMLLEVLSGSQLERLCEELGATWEASLPRWRSRGEVVLLHALEQVLCRAVCRWAGVPLPDDETVRRTAQLSALIDGAGSVGPRNWWGFVQRRRVEHWISQVISDVRAGRLSLSDDSAAAVIARHRGLDGELLPVDVASVELINVLRPTVAVARFLTFAALALHEHPDRRPDPADDRSGHHFAQEVRRFYPFFPMVGGRAVEDFVWRGRRFAAGTWMILDLYGTNRDGRIWDAPDEFRPERFEGWGGGAFALIPQGGGDHEHGHRCAGEWATVALLERGIQLLTSARYRVPPQALHIDLRRMPARPASGLAVRFG